MWSRLYRKHVIMAFPSYDTVTNAWAPQADINWFAGSSHDSQFARFSECCATEEEAVAWALSRSKVWVDNRLQRLRRAILPGRGRGIDIIEAAKTHLGKVTPEQPVRGRSATEPGSGKTLTFYVLTCAFGGSGFKTQRREFAEKPRGIDQTRSHGHRCRLELRKKLEHTRQDLTAAMLPRGTHIPLRQRLWRKV